jgi:hypothetical protein
VTGSRPNALPTVKGGVVVLWPAGGRAEAGPVVGAGAASTWSPAITATGPRVADGVADGGADLDGDPVAMGEAGGLTAACGPVPSCVTMSHTSAHTVSAAPATAIRRRYEARVAARRRRRTDLAADGVVVPSSGSLSGSPTAMRATPGAGPSGGGSQPPIRSRVRGAFSSGTYYSPFRSPSADGDPQP